VAVRAARKGVEEFRNAYKILFGKTLGEKPLGKPRRGWEYNIKIYLEI
jgi:hypothetical protein